MSGKPMRFEKRVLAVMFLLALLPLAISGAFVEAAKKKSFDTFHLRRRFIAGMTTFDRAAVTRWADQEVRLTESLYDTRPSLKIKYDIVRQTTAGGRTLANMTFKNSREFRKFMDKHFDNVATSRTSGYMKILLVNSIQVRDKAFGGYAWFPHWVDPFGRKFAPIVVYRSVGTLAHELGHVFSLKHTFEPYVNPKPQAEL
ncbi:MAG: hypothetical protein ACE5IM_09995 [Nitrospinota bacterium]